MVPRSEGENLISKNKDRFLVSVYPRNYIWEEIIDSPFLRLIKIKWTGPCAKHHGEA